MASLTDIAPLSEKVAGVTVPGISAGGIAYLLNKFPELRRMMSGRDVAVDDLISIAPHAVAAIIAAGTGSPGDEEQEQAAARLPLDLQADFLTAILKVTMPRGVAPFMGKLRALGSILDAKGAALPTVPATSSRRPSKR